MSEGSHSVTQSKYNIETETQRRTAAAQHTKPNPTAASNLASPPSPPPSQQQQASSRRRWRRREELGLRRPCKRKQPRNSLRRRPPPAVASAVLAARREQQQQARSVPSPSLLPRPVARCGSKGESSPTASQSVSPRSALTCCAGAAGNGGPAANGDRAVRQRGLCLVIRAPGSSNLGVRIPRVRRNWGWRGFWIRGDELGIGESELCTAVSRKGLAFRCSL
ncbi:hypothetical protein PR202_ga30034 [Eleusine coracana subsp. coracana]|uniref:Uncharacterized protein n=1 Tax=Eleusine coracana subsp. coracana TaxID=191504 RepID=A0AAV5DNP4_ELECO|nr:hypothetical protein PR202_ga30019 [Eleusine coracana subsp. coracana]GJN11810.1 hypothetical protein PR202_ga30034 [Eleusine coracana subsp. coracana]